MTPQEVAAVLAAAALRDNRTVGPADVMAWLQDIGDLDPADALAAVSRHYRDSTERLMPAHVRRLAKAIRAERREAEHHEIRALPGRFETDDDRALRIKTGVAHCRDVLGALMADLERRRTKIEDEA